MTASHSRQKCTHLKQKNKSYSYNAYLCAIIYPTYSQQSQPYFNYKSAGSYFPASVSFAGTGTVGYLINN